MFAFRPAHGKWLKQCLDFSAFLEHFKKNTMLFLSVLQCRLRTGALKPLFDEIWGNKQCF